MEETKVMFGWYSSKQQECRQSDYDIKHPYLYYFNMDDEIVQVSGVICSEEEKSLWDDAFCVGQLKRFYKATSEPINIIMFNSNRNKIVE